MLLHVITGFPGREERVRSRKNLRNNKIKLNKMKNNLLK